MTTRFQHYWQSVQESLWFVPGLMVLSSLGLAYGLVAFDVHTNWQGQKQFPLLFGSGADGARDMLSAISGSMLMVAALAFFLTLATINAKGNHAVLQRLLQALAVAADAAYSPDRKPVLGAQVRLLMDYATQTLSTEYEKQQVRDLYDQLMTKTNVLR
jgi:uncharacterized membrane protein